MNMSNTMRVVILGKTGSGKSSLANTIFGEETFMVDHTLNSGTSECQVETRSVNGQSITLMDTPGFFDTERSEEDLKREIVRCITGCTPGPHAFLIVLKVEKFTKIEQAFIATIRKRFSEEVLKYATLVFTHGDQLQEGQTIDDFVHQNQNLSDLVTEFGRRCHVVDNKYWNENPQDENRSNQFQVQELLKTIIKVKEANQGSCYTNDMLHAAEEKIKEQEHIRLRQQAEGSKKKLWIKLTGILKGALLGAIFGVVVQQVKATGVFGLLEITAAGGAAGMSLNKLTRAYAAVGAVIGSVAGYFAAEGADTPQDAVERRSCQE
uniref:GTPase IMAP family member 7-like n=1 Tax=Semicossyphus pulcher TaxID=241346 RepID=UPI0037E7E5A6